MNGAWPEVRLRERRRAASPTSTPAHSVEAAPRRVPFSHQTARTPRMPPAVEESYRRDTLLAEIGYAVIASQISLILPITMLLTIAADTPTGPSFYRRLCCADRCRWFDAGAGRRHAGSTIILRM